MRLLLVCFLLGVAMSPDVVQGQGTLTYPSQRLPGYSLPGYSLPGYTLPGFRDAYGSWVPPVSVPPIAVPPVSVPAVTVPQATFSRFPGVEYSANGGTWAGQPWTSGQGSRTYYKSSLPVSESAGPGLQYTLPSAPSPGIAENGSYFGELSGTTLRPKTVHVRGYFRRDGTYVQSHYRSRARR